MSQTLVMSPIASISLQEKPEQTQFAPGLLTADTLKSVPSGFVIRPFARDDVDKGYLDVLGELTTVGSVARRDFEERFDWLQARQGEYFVVVLEDVATRRIAGTGTLLVEHKFIHGCGKVGHIEDIVVSEKFRGRNLGKVVIDALKQLSVTAGCYKTILSCLEKNVVFYEKCGLVRKEVSMAVYF